MYTFLSSGAVADCLKTVGDAALCSTLHTAYPPLWWVSTTFGTIVFSLFFLTWALVLVNLGLLMFFLVHKLFGKKK
ncbi:MAG: hypothetical protein COU47_03265 [Candidatus Niyogibacteria bacterium CG10_big_fil_rev_8_21_14_0_10_46_36]|uniref:Uncharacterized protein n=1 Tax=Candidatus Niyogibacteria bacterium CG10_big_fil_rev_8_21_14_0_10_46_36 TaxID=1974726 RepID=A0A2H0TCU1_9BACT|nr:MAG: hypothetical protein COU47_03265 [Candidatus Niyogibacteria bacterium CG10_big_fil_rev_8_21_14_0_10_46_36]